MDLNVNFDVMAECSPKIQESANAYSSEIEGIFNTIARLPEVYKGEASSVFVASANEYKASLEELATILEEVKAEVNTAYNTYSDAHQKNISLSNNL